MTTPATKRVFSRKRNHRFYPGMGENLHEFTIDDYVADLDEEFANYIALNWPHMFRLSAWPEAMLEADPVEEPIDVPVTEPVTEPPVGMPVLADDVADVPADATVDSGGVQ